MAHVTGKRKRQDGPHPSTKPRKIAKEAATNGNGTSQPKSSSGEVKHTEAVPHVGSIFHDGKLHLQIVTGSYERVLHGFSASIPQALLQKKPSPSTGETSTASTSTEEDEPITFSDTFLFAAHASSVRCLAISPPTEADKRFLATGSSDERINVYSVSTAPPSTNGEGAPPPLTGISITENPRNRSLGSLIHHDRAITCLNFPAKGKLFSAAEDNTIAISRTRDWTVLSSIKAPIPKAQGRPSGDTAGPGETPAGVNDLAIHPSQKLMLTVGRGERCMRLWNLMTGKKAGVLNFSRNLLAQVGEGKYSSGEGRRVLWDEAGETYVVGFERGAAVFGIDSQPRAVIRPSPSTKLHQMHSLPRRDGGEQANVLAVSTEDGRILFYDTTTLADETDMEKLPVCVCLAQACGAAAGVSGRIKDFDVITLPPSKDGGEESWLLVTANSDGAVRLWLLHASEIMAVSKAVTSVGAKDTAVDPRQVGKLLGTLETNHRVTCLGAFVMDGKVGENAVRDIDAAMEEERGDGSEESE